MRNSNVCPKCQAKDIIRIPGWIGAFGTGNNIPTRKFPITTSSNVLVTRYVCGACGFSEEWIDTPGDIEKLRVRPQTS